MNAPFVRNACPTLSHPMQTGDGLLARLSPVAAGIAPQALLGLAEAARRHGNGILEVTQRGSLQIRGLTESSAVAMAAEVEQLRIAVRAGLPVETGPLAGLDPEELADARPLADAIRAAAGRLDGRLGPKVSVVVDGGGRVGLHEVLADVRLDAVMQDGAVLWQVALAGTRATARPLGLFDASDARALALAGLEAIAALGIRARGRDIADDGRSALPPSALPGISPSRGEIGQLRTLPSSVELKSSTPQLRISTPGGEIAGRPEGGAVPPAYQLAPIALADTRHAVPVAVPFGSIDAAALVDLIRSTPTLQEARLAPGRRLLLILPDRADAGSTRLFAHRLGFIINPEDSRLDIVACPGAPACASGRILTRDIAKALAGGGLLPALHVSGCAKRCAAPRHEGLALIGEEAGASLLIDGETPHLLGTVPAAQAAEALSRALARLAQARRPGESDRDLLRRVDRHALASAFAARA
jgi:precorrin-3B synthase